MYRIIGGDGKQYGPIGDDVVRRWIAEGRANSQTLVQPEGSPDWRPLGTFPEFAQAFTGGVPSAMPMGAPPPGDRSAALQAVRAPAVALKVTAILGLVVAALGLVMNVLTVVGFQFNRHSFNHAEMDKIFTFMSGGMGIFQNILGAAMAVVILLGAGKLERLESHAFAMTASILAMVPCVSPCCWLGLPFGIWALVVMNRPEVKPHFS